MPALPDISIPQNERVLAYYSPRLEKFPLLAAPDSVPQPYLTLGSHPDIVARIWDELGRTLLGGRWIVSGTPGLVQPDTGVILAFACGTQYCLRLSGAQRAAALQAGAKTLTKWSNGEVLDAQQTFGEDWLFWAWLPQEEQWLLTQQQWAA